MKILVLNGSPKVKSDTMNITRAFLNGVNESKRHNINIVNVINKHIGPCYGCFKCWENGDGKCVINDDMNYILEEIVKSDVIIWSFPLYNYGMPSHLKAVLDRTVPLSRKSMVIVDGATKHEHITGNKSRQFIMISGCGFPNVINNFESAAIQFDYCFGKNNIKICISESPMFNSPEADIVTKPRLRELYEAGKEFDETQALSENTISKITTNMIPVEDYINIVNYSQR